ncbi:hypothetical protein HNP33_003616 [Comamonas odontotermitis]|uniref:MalT-like TPR region domain-containing protein n=1 Tax=Comamonas odontotermitis TaxID=379895 RepID=A0ABR6RJZ6_9BURK|nr:hypothetical protein [Comamonas odontotermitis]MBB6579503.1 hypothetical protein [Comamonas odontotermitis]
MEHAFEQQQLLALLVQLQAGNWQVAHDGVQRHNGLLAAWLHGLVHLQEGDLEDAENWYDRAGRRFRQRVSFDEEMALLRAALQADAPQNN